MAVHIVYNTPYTRLRFTFIAFALWWVWSILVAAASAFIASFADSNIGAYMAEQHVIVSFITFVGVVISWFALSQDTTEESDTYKNIMEDRR